MQFKKDGIITAHSRPSVHMSLPTYHAFYHVDHDMVDLFRRANLTPFTLDLFTCLL